jgi:hypothetical protein
MTATLMDYKALNNGCRLFPGSPDEP